MKVIKTDKDYQAALKKVETLMVGDPEPKSKKGKRLIALSKNVADYETKTFTR